MQARICRIKRAHVQRQDGRVEHAGPTLQRTLSLLSRFVSRASKAEPDGDGVERFDSCFRLSSVKLFFSQSDLFLAVYLFILNYRVPT